MRYLLLLAALALALLAAGCATGPAGSARAVAPASGGLTITMNSIAEHSTGNPYMTPRAGYQFVVVDFGITNNGASSYHFTPLAARLIDPAGYQYAYSPWFAAVNGYFGVTDIPAGQTARGKLLFEVPPAAAGTTYTLRVAG